MPPKRKAKPSPVSPTHNRKRQRADNGQQTLDDLFKSPNKNTLHRSLNPESPSSGRAEIISPCGGTGSQKRRKEIPIEIIVLDEDEDDVEMLPSNHNTSQPGPAGTTGGSSAVRMVDDDENDSKILPDSLPGSSKSASAPAAGGPTSTSSVFLSSQDNTISYPDLTCDPLFFDVSVCPWQCHKGAPYSFLAHAFVALSSTRSRILLVNTLVNTLRTILRHAPPSLLATLYLLSNSITPAYVPVEMNIGPSIISKALQSVSGLSSAALRKMYSSLGDPGDVAYEAKSCVRTLVPHPPLLIQGVYDALLQIARAKGVGAAKQKQSIIERLLVSAKGEEPRFLVRTFAQNLRVGAVRTTMISSLARALVLTRSPSPPPPPLLGSDVYATTDLLSSVLPQPLDGKKKANTADPARDAIKEMFLRAEGLLKRVFVQHPDYGHIVDAILNHGFEALPEQVPLTIGVPLHPTLGSPTRSLDEIYERLGDLPFAAEFKYDGQRAQVHASRANDGSSKHLVKLFSRHLEDMTGKYPDVISLVQWLFERSPDLSSFIIDAEIVAVDPDNGDVRSFQELSNRPKKDVNLHEVKVVVCLFIFDLMYYNERTLLSEPFRTRRDMLRTNFPPLTPENKFTARLAHVESCESGEGRESIEDFFQSAVLSKSEGLMIKLLDSGVIIDIDNDDNGVEASTNQSPKKGKGKANRKPLPATYEPDKRTSAWLKLKKDYVKGLGDTFDLVPVGAWHGNGRKAKWWSPVLMAIWDPRLDRLVAVCKAMVERYPEGSDTCSGQPFKGVNCDFGDLRPAVYFKPSEVWELQGADITLSPRSVAALGHISDKRGLSIRFPRFIRIRDDKTIEDATGPDVLADLFRKQEGRNGKKVAEGGIDDVDLIDVEIGEEVESEESD
ncbi:hypothetical protein FRB99_002100 [Tulasnella sp. 403]|nr:hypothetical protein FRB99_002100 [Tulasnella sp. 403]